MNLEILLLYTAAIVKMRGRRFDVNSSWIESCFGELDPVEEPANVEEGELDILLLMFVPKETP